MIHAYRNFCVIAHIDHGKSTLADRFLELTRTVEPRQMREQVLDTMDLERERGITIKLTPVRMEYRRNTTDYILNLVDTPGHVDFSYEVSRSLAAVEGTILLVDATQGVQAQTLANLELARAAQLVIIPAVNKIDAPGADVEGTRRELSALLGIPETDVLLVSAKTGAGVQELLDAVIRRIPPPRGSPTEPFRGLIFDSTFEAYRGVIVYIRVVDGTLTRQTPITFAGSGADATALEVGIFCPNLTPQETLTAGEVGYVATGLRESTRARVGDTLVKRDDRGKVTPVPGYQKPQPNVYVGVYPGTETSFPELREALEKLQLSDASLTVESEQSPALGQGYRCGFLGLLHVDIVRERLRREFGIETTLTVPSVAYTITVRTRTPSTADVRVIRSAADFPDSDAIQEVREPWVEVRVIARTTDVGPVFQLLSHRGGSSPHTETLGGHHIAIVSELPLREVIADFHDALKAVTSGYGSFSTRPLGERPVDLLKVSLLVNHEPVEALSVLVPASHAEAEGRRMVEKLKGAIPRHLFAVPLQATVGGKVIARETIPALRKDVTGHLYGGDVTRKRKLLEKQKKGKTKLASRGSVTIPPEAYLAVLKRS
ncbi:MAG: GTP-binding protein LepA [Parcubacteria group bacterium Gr01-1014_38]|nr:MAG: GTP-binding protein LepA [Parcubacteria group bacterium Gr01-1014_38]